MKREGAPYPGVRETREEREGRERRLVTMNHRARHSKGDDSKAVKRRGRKRGTPKQGVAVDPPGTKHCAGSAAQLSVVCVKRGGEANGMEEGGTAAFQRQSGGRAEREAGSEAG